MDLGDRMKRHEQAVGSTLIYRCPAILRVDGRAFHSFTHNLDRPWDANLEWLMRNTAIALCEEISSAKFAYGQSDEISILLTDYDNFQTEQWFGGKVQKMVSVAASIATASFNQGIADLLEDLPERERPPHFASAEGNLWYPKMGRAMFDARIFSIPADDVVNYFLWRQQDATRNSISMLGRSKFSHSQLIGKSCDQVQEMLWQEHQTNWNDCPVHRKRGWCVYRSQVEGDIRPKWTYDLEPPIFAQDRGFVGRWLEVPAEEMV